MEMATDKRKRQEKEKSWGHCHIVSLVVVGALFSWWCVSGMITEISLVLRPLWILNVATHVLSQRSIFPLMTDASCRKIGNSICWFSEEGKSPNCSLGFFVLSLLSIINLYLCRTLQFMFHSCKKGHWFEKSTPLPVVTNISYGSGMVSYLLVDIVISNF